MRLSKYLLLLVILIKSSFGQAQPTTDTICLPIPVFKKVYSAALEKKYVDSLLVLTEKQVAELRHTVDLMQEKDSELKLRYEDQITNLNSQIGLYKDQLNTYEKLLRLEKRKRRLTTAAGIITTGLAIYLGTLK